MNNEVKRRSPNSPGYSYAKFGRETGLPYRRIIAAVDAGEIRTVTLGGVTRIPETEKDRVMRLLNGEAAE